MATYFRKLPVEVRQRIEKEMRQQEPLRTSRLDAVVEKPLAGRRQNNGYEEGRMNEERVFAVGTRFRDAARAPEWFLGIARGTQREDAEGIDAHVEVHITRLETHRIPLQIKSSETGRRKFRKDPRRWHIPCVVVHERMTDEEVFDAILAEIRFVREAVLRARGVR